MDTDKTTRPLEGLRVIDFSRVLAGPYCTAMFADLGADVIKIESPKGDDYRHVGPFRDGESLLFQAVNRGKRSIALDLKDPEAVKAVRALCRTADLVVENFRPGVMERLGLGPETLRAANPRLVYLSVSGFGQSGPNVARPAYDIIVQAMSGLMHVTGEPDGPPTMIGEALGDVAGGLFAAWGAMVALFERERTGHGRHVDVALFDSLVSMMPVTSARVLLAGEEPQRTGNRHALSAPFGTYRAADGHFAVAVLNDRLFQTFCNTIGAPSLAENPHFATDTLRRENEPMLAAIIEAWSESRTTQQVVEALGDAGIPAAPIETAGQAWRSAQAGSRNLSVEVEHPGLGPVRVPQQPVHFGGAPRTGGCAAPALDQHREEILAALCEGETR
ncbi:CaiB/BaiF CoA transferase family protein [Stappia stellulata]|uniref:CaiB/BaiF CoA transferase family protein n=1 Tax=Stappia stellulata TaxID=71235 RepID=UPI0003F73B54|nr:CoA transferase [Stappia stellulata]